MRLGVFGGVVALIVGSALMVSASSSAQKEEPMVIQPPLFGDEVATIVVKVWTHFDGLRSHPDRGMHIAKAAGFTVGNSSCDILTTWEVVGEYEQRENRPEVREEIIVTIAGEPYEGSLRPMGVNVLNLGLACIDLLPPASNKDLKKIPLSSGKNIPLSVAYDASSKELIPGTPFINKEGKVVAVLIGMFAFDNHSSSGPSPGFVSAADIDRFLTLALDVPRAEPALHHRPITAGQ
jgi:hypothetical protein